MSSTTIDELVLALQQACIKTLQCKNSQEWWTNLIKAVEARDELLRAEVKSAPAPSATEDTKQADLEAFTAWLHAQDGFEANSHVVFKSHPKAGNGVFVKPGGSDDGGGIAKDVAVFSVPLPMCIGYYDSQSSPLPVELQKNRVVQSNASVELAMILLHERALGEQGRFAPYIRILPSSFPSLPPIAWSRADLELIQDLNVCVVIGHRVLDICLSFCHLRADVNQAASPSFLLRDFMWAMGVVMTRQNPLPEGKLALVPAFDMCNHDAALSEISTAIEAADEGDAIPKLVSRAARDFASGEEVTIFYGPRPNDEFLSHAGFVVPGNRYSKLVLPVQLSTSPLPVQHVLLNGLAPQVTRSGSTENSYLLTIGWADCSALAAFARADCATNKDLAAAALKRKLGGGGGGGDDVMAAQERALVQQVLRQEIARHAQQLQLSKTKTAAKPEVARVVGELRQSIVALLEHCLAHYT